MKTLIAALGCALLVSGCVSPKIPDDVPPAPPARKGEPYAAPSIGGEAEGGEEGFGGEGFGGDTPTMEVEPSDLPAETEEPEAEEEAEGEAKPDGKDDPKKKDAAKDGDKKKPVDGETKGKEPSPN